ncbi:hypothetical protein VB005_09313 [Metarhizium brunneum]
MAATLSNAKIHFHTNDEDKDPDTHVTIIVRDDNHVTAARKDSDFVRFGDGSDHTYPLEVKNHSTAESLQSGTVYIRIDPRGGRGHDTWRFNWDIDLVFNDGSHLACDVALVELNQDHREETWGIQGIVRAER